MVMLAVLVLTLTPAAVVTAAWKKSKILLLSMTLSVLLFGLSDPSDITPLVGRLAPAGPMLLLEMKLPLFVIISFCAPLIRRIVLVLAVAEAVVFESVSELPPTFSPLMLTFLAPFKLISG